MHVIADLHMHGPYSRGTSKDLTFDQIEKYARMKGLGIVGTGDFTHPAWIKEIKERLHETSADSGIFANASGFAFMLTTEVSLVYTHDGKGYRVHMVVLAPSLAAVEGITKYLLTKGRIDYDGRPIFKIPCAEFVEALSAIDPRIEAIPAHIWTPWFSLFGSKSGYDLIDRCFGDQIKKIHALETGISSDPAMNFRLKQLDRFRFVSFSDSHSAWPWRMGREATRFEVDEIRYDSILSAIRTGKGFAGTIETSPDYGKYHLDGHRACQVRMTPSESKACGGKCPKCGKALTIGVLNRVEELADRPVGYVREDHPGFATLLPLCEVIASAEGKGVATKGVWAAYERLLRMGNEYDILLNRSREELLGYTTAKIAEAIIAIREGRVRYLAGYDGEYGKAIVLDPDGNEISLGSDGE